MKQLQILFLLFLCPFSFLFAQNCKPDIDRLDKITKEKEIVWYQELYATPFFSSMLQTTDIGLLFMVGKSEGKNLVQLNITKIETSTTKAAFESALKGTKGDKILIGFKDSDKPLSFIADEATNNSKAAKNGEQYTTTISLTTYITDSDLVKYKELLTTKNMDAIRITLADNQKLETDIKEKKAEKMKEKFSCFYKYIETNK